MFSFTIVRYSLLSDSGRGYGLVKRVGLEGYREALFAPDRLRQRAWLFENVALYSLLRQRPALDPHRHRLLVVTSADLPPEARARLDEMLAPHRWAEVLALESSADIHKALRARIAEVLEARFGVAREVPFATLRLDDDDALGSRFFDQIEPYRHLAFRDHVISFGRGFAARLDEQDRFAEFRELVFPSIALGLTHVGAYNVRKSRFTSEWATIFELKGHMKIHRRTPVILECRTPSWVRTLHTEQDSRSAFHPMYLKGALVEPDNVRKWTPLSPAMSPPSAGADAAIKAA